MSKVVGRFGAPSALDQGIFGETSNLLHNTTIIFTYITCAKLTTMVKYLIHGLYDRRINMKIALFLFMSGGQGHWDVAQTFPRLLPHVPWVQTLCLVNLWDIPRSLHCRERPLPWHAGTSHFFSFLWWRHTQEIFRENLSVISLQITSNFTKLSIKLISAVDLE